MLHADWLAHRATLTPDRPALVEVDRGGMLTYSALHRSANRAARTLVDCGVGTGDRVAVHARNRRTTWRRSGRPARSLKTFPGNRDDPIRAWTMATRFIGIEMPRLSQGRSNNHQVTSSHPSAFPRNPSSISH